MLSKIEHEKRFITSGQGKKKTDAFIHLQKACKSSMDRADRHHQSSTLTR